jgi:hypothetical protein
MGNIFVFRTSIAICHQSIQTTGYPPHHDSRADLIYLHTWLVVYSQGYQVPSTSTDQCSVRVHCVVMTEAATGQRAENASHNEVLLCTEWCVLCWVWVWHSCTYLFSLYLHDTIRLRLKSVHSAEWRRWTWAKDTVWDLS